MSTVDLREKEASPEVKIERKKKLIPCLYS